MALDGAVLEIDATINDTDVTGVFEMSGNINVQETTRPQYFIENLGGAEIKGIHGSFLTAMRQAGLVDNLRNGVTLDLGGGEHRFEIDFLGWEGSDKSWGDIAGDSGDPAYDATGEDAVKQIQVLNRFLLKATTDSNNPARLYVGEYTDGTYGTAGDWSSDAPINVHVDVQRGIANASEGGKQSFNGTINCTRILSLNTTYDKVVDSFK